MAIPQTLAEAEILYKQFCDDWETNLKSYGIKKPGAFGSNASLLYTYAYANLGKTFSGEDALDFATKMAGRRIADPQELRHMSNVHGYNARGRSGHMPDGTKVSSGQYALVDMLTPAPDWKNARSEKVKTGDWEDIKKHYNYKCAMCGSLEGKPNTKKSGTLTVLEKGHMDPRKTLGPGNMIPQCQLCNKPYKDNAVFDKNGFVYAIANTKFVERADLEVQKECWEYLQKKFGKVTKTS